MVQNPSKADGGPYKCHVKNEHGESNAKLNLNIEADPEPSGLAPTFIEKPRMESSADGKKVTMSCKVKADPKPSVIWTRESVTVKESSRISITIVQEKDTYAIKLVLTVISLDCTIDKILIQSIITVPIGSTTKRRWFV